MPIINVFPDVQRAYNRVEINWADAPGVQYARVLRVDVETGTCTPLRPYICYNGDYLLLSCGHGIFWDTEVPLDRSVYYITEGLDAPCLPTSTLVSDTFTRTVVNGWGSTESGTLGPLPYTLTGGTVPGNYDVTAGKGTHTLDTTNVIRYSVIDIGSPNFDIYATVSTPVTASGAPITTRLVGRYSDTANLYVAGLVFATTGLVTLQIARVVGGVGALIQQFADGAYAPNQEWRVRFQGNGSSLKLKAWIAALPEPDAWSIETSDTSLTSGDFVGVSSRADTGNLNGTIAIPWDDLLVVNECLPCEPVTVDTSATPTTMPSNGAFRLRDPVRPCNDIYMPLCFDQENAAQVGSQFCVPGSGVFFASMDNESYEPNALLLNPTNAKYPISISRTRRGVSSNLTVVSRTFADRDAILTLNEPGSPLLLQGPPQYGIPDRYMAVQTVNVDRGLTDHKRQPRVIMMPHVEVARPAGPTQGVCGSQVADLCDIYSTWDEMAAAGLTWDDLVRGRAGAETAPEFIDYRTWDEVEAEFADWNAVDDGTRTWHDLEVGD